MDELVNRAARDLPGLTGLSVIKTVGVDGWVAVVKTPKVYGSGTGSTPEYALKAAVADARSRKRTA